MVAHVTRILHVVQLLQFMVSQVTATDLSYTFTLVGLPSPSKNRNVANNPTLLGANLTLVTNARYDISKLLNRQMKLLSNPIEKKQSKPVVATDSGKVRGVQIKILEKTVDAFLGIPFAEPPIGHRRFRRPERVTPWNGILDTNEFGHPCMQINYTAAWDWVFPKKPQSEDCLTLNIWTPEQVSCTAKKTKKRYCELKTVLIYIYGGGFNIGASDWEFYDGRTLAAYGDIVVATMNYRLGPLGFLNAGIHEVPGNMGLYDQQMAIRWLYENIKHFGGDPSKMILMGESAGAVSVGLHLISPMSRYMIKRVIMHSGSPLWDTPDNTIDGPKKANEFAEIFGCANRTYTFDTNREEVLDCMRAVDAEFMYSKSFEVLGKRVLTYHPRWGDQFMPLKPKDAMRQGFFKDVDTLMGVNKDEGSIFVANTMPDIFMNGPLPNMTRDEASFYMIFFFQYILRSGTRHIRDHYFGHLENDDYENVRQAFIDAIGDYLQICPTVYFGEKMADYGNDVYMYFFNHRPSNSYWDKWLGVAHFDELQFAFGMPLRFPQEFTKEEADLSRKMMDIWIGFMKDGKPPSYNGMDWPKYSIKTPYYMKLDTNPLTQGRGPHEKNCKFFKQFILR